MFHHHCRQKFHLDAATRSCVGGETIERKNLEPTCRSAGVERSNQFKSMLSRFGRYLGDLAESRHSVR